MITRLELQNWRCFKQVDVSFGQLTVLVGANGSGKTTLMRALAPHGIAVEPWQRATWPIRRRLTSSSGSVATDLALGPGQRSWDPGGPEWSCLSLRLDAEKMRQANTLSPENRLSETGSNLHNVFFTLPRKQQIEVGAQLAALVPVIADVESRPHGSGTHRLWFQDRWNADTWYSPDEVSDGTLYVLAYLLLSLARDPPDVLCIEEPERGLHPYLIEQVIRLLRGISRGDLGRKAIQVVLATQSAELLEHALPEEVRFLDRDPVGGACTVEPAPTSEPAWSEAFETYERSLRGMWLSGTLGAVPGA